MDSLAIWEVGSIVADIVDYSRMNEKVWRGWKSGDNRVLFYTFSLRDYTLLRTNSKFFWARCLTEILRDPDSTRSLF